MSRHHALLVIALCLIGGSGAAVAQDRPNIILIFSDDHALRAVSAYGDARFRGSRRNNAGPVARRWRSETGPLPS